MVAKTAYSEDAPALEIRDLRVDYGEFVAVDEISLEVPKGEVIGIVGPNGAGKTSTFKVISTLLEPTYGDIKLCGIDILENQEAARRILGYMPDLAPVPRDLRVFEFLDLYADAHRLGSKKARRSRVDECLEAVNLMDKRTSWCKEMSRGQTQRLVLAKTMLHCPKVLVLDEPASGLDALSRREMRLSLRQLADDGATVVISSHILEELAEMCTALCIMSLGKIVSRGSAEDVRRELGQTIQSLVATLVDQPDNAAKWLGDQAGVDTVAVTQGNRVTCNFDGDGAAQADLLAAMIGAGFRVRAFGEGRSSFEDILANVASEARTPPPLPQQAQDVVDSAEPQISQS